MQRIILVYGVISGFIIIGSALLSMSLLDDGQTAHTSLEWLGYLIMLIAFSMIFVAIKQHRDR